MIISSGSSDKVEIDKLEIEMDKLSKQKIEVEIDKIIIFSTIDLMTDLASKSWAIVYNSKAKTLLITRSHFVNDKCMIFTLLNRLARQIIYPI